MLKIGEWGLRTITAYAADINRNRRTPLRFSLNVSVLEFMQRDMVGFVRQTLDDAGCRPEWRTLELTKDLMITESGDMRRAFESLRRLGVGVSIDDFNTGYFNLQYLESFPFDEIKVDRSFVHDLAHSITKQVILETIVKLAAALDIRVEAEGIDTEAERTIMRTLGCSVGQDYLFAAPLNDFQSRRLLDQGLVLRESWNAKRLLSMLDNDVS